MKKFVIKSSFKGAKIMGRNIGVVILDAKTSQKDLKKLFKEGFTNIVEEIVIEDAKES
tara:strand:- start:3713 stop:3886 length:174 start_codon:yes stop_codon:yes gene_type:complete